MKDRLVYFPLKLYVRAFLHSYFKNYQIQGIEKIPSGPVIFVSNHQNAFMDALVITCASRRNPYFLSRASIFKKKWASAVLRMIRLIPIYRIRDGFSSVKKNEEVFDKCISLLSYGKCILVFPEGNHHDRFYLRPFQKGAARIAFESEAKYRFNLGLKLVPVGIQYEDYDKIGSSVLVSFGDPLFMKDYENQYKEDSNNALLNLTSDLKDAISNLIVDISPVEKYEEIYRYWQSRRVKKLDLKLRLEKDQLLISEYEKHGNQQEPAQKKEGNNRILNLVHLTMKMISSVNLIIPLLLIRYVIRNKLKEPMFEGSMRFALWAFPGMLILSLQFGWIYLLTTNLLISFGYLLSSAFVAIISVKTRPEN